MRPAQSESFVTLRPFSRQVRGQIFFSQERGTVAQVCALPPGAFLGRNVDPEKADAPAPLVAFR